MKSAVEGRIKADSELANLKLDVNAKANGEIQLEGKAQNADQVGKAIALALDTDGVTKVTSKIKKKRAFEEMFLEGRPPVNVGVSRAISSMISDGCA